MTKLVIKDFEYDTETETLYIRHPILVSEFLGLKKYFKHIQIIEVKHKW